MRRDGWRHLRISVCAWGIKGIGYPFGMSLYTHNSSHLNTVSGWDNFNFLLRDLSRCIYKGTRVWGLMRKLFCPDLCQKKQHSCLTWLLRGTDILRHFVRVVGIPTRQETFWSSHLHTIGNHGLMTSEIFSIFGSWMLEHLRAMWLIWQPGKLSTDEDGGTHLRLRIQPGTDLRTACYKGSLLPWNTWASVRTWLV